MKPALCSKLSLTLCAAALVGTQGTLCAQSNTIGWGDYVYSQLVGTSGSYVELAAGYLHALGRRADGTATAWGFNVFGQCNVPDFGWTYVELAAGMVHSVARFDNGRVWAWGSNTYGQCTVPILPLGRTYVEVAAGDYHTVARVDDGTVRAWGYNGAGQCTVPGLPSGVGYVEVAAGSYHTLARLSDGSVVAFGLNDRGQCDVPPLSSGLTYVEVEGGEAFTVARRSDGSVVAWGSNDYGQCNVPALPLGVTYVEISAGWKHALARRSDGSMVGWGLNSAGTCNVIDGLDYIDVEAGGNFTLARYVGLTVTRYCPYAEYNSTGQSGVLVAIGSNVVGSNDVTLQASHLPRNSFGYMLTSRTSQIVPHVPNSQGRLCLGGSIGRFVGLGQILNSGVTGAFSLVIDLQTMPQPSGSVAVQAGETWHFQAWYRDANPSPTSNFTDAFSVTFN
jgi:hypothetical protein